MNHASARSGIMRGLVVILGAPALCAAQTDLYSNGSAAPGVPALGVSATTLSGVPAPAGYMWSEVPAAGGAVSNAVAGFSSHSTGLSGSYRFADDFTVPLAWRVASFSFYAYQTDATPLMAPFNAVSVRIWSGRPDEEGSEVVFGDATTNRLIGSESMSVYRVFNTLVEPAPLAPDTTRLVWRADAGVGEVRLEPGTYWVDWQFASVDPAAPLFAPPATIAGSRGPVEANAMHFRPAGDEGAWMALVDPGKPGSAPDAPQDLAFIIRGLVAGTCVGDFNTDGTVNSQDLFDFLTAFFADLPSADVNDDGVVNSQDFFDFLGAFFAGC